MTDNKMVDFDAFRAEQDEQPVLFKIGGKTYDLPPALPASVAVDVIRMKQELGDDGNADFDKLEAFCQNIFGKELWSAIMQEHRITMTELPQLLTMVLATYTDTDEGPKAEASPTSPRKARSSASSSRGRGSKPTS